MVKELEMPLICKSGGDYGLRNLIVSHLSSMPGIPSGYTSQGKHFSSFLYWGTIHPAFISPCTWVTSLFLPWSQPNFLIWQLPLTELAAKIPIQQESGFSVTPLSLRGVLTCMQFCPHTRESNMDHCSITRERSCWEVMTTITCYVSDADKYRLELGTPSFICQVGVIRGRFQGCALMSPSMNHATGEISHDSHALENPTTHQFIDLHSWWDIDYNKWSIIGGLTLRWNSTPSWLCYAHIACSVLLPKPWHKSYADLLWVG